MANVKTLRDEQNEVARGITPLLRLLSPYSVYEPYENMEYDIAKPTKLHNVPEVEKYAMQGRFTASDMFILKAIDSLGYCNATATRHLLRYMHKQDLFDASAKNRPALNIPSGEDANEYFDRLLYLCQKGLVIRHRFLPNPDWKNEPAAEENSTKKEGYRYFYHLTGIASNMYKTKLQDRKIVYNPAVQYLPEVEVFRQVSSSILAGAMLQCPYLVDVKFQFKKNVQSGYKKENISLYSVMKMNPNGAGGNPQLTTRVIIDSITLNTNQHIQTSESRREWMRSRIRELSLVRSEYRKEGAVKILLVAENALTLNLIRDEIFSVDPAMAGDMIFTSGAILEKFHVMDHPEMLRKSFIEFPVGKNGVPSKTPKGAVGYYFLLFGDAYSL